MPENLRRKQADYYKFKENQPSGSHTKQTPIKLIEAQFTES